MKKLVLIGLLVLCGCVPSPNPFQRVEKAFPGADVKALPGFTDKFAVKTTNGEVWFAEIADAWTIQTNLLFRSNQ
jgi:hypothetical protein